MAIPPPPLPEFYMPDKSGKKKVTTSASDTRFEPTELVFSPKPPKTGTSSWQIEAAFDGTDERYAYSRRMAAHATNTRAPTSSPSRSESELPSLAVYHICRICLRPRSARYHREHPIPVDGVPPPPSICRRCRVTPADELRSVTEIVEHPKSNEVKLGVRCLVPDADYFSNAEARERRTTLSSSRVEWHELEPLPKESHKDQDEVIHRHIHIAVPPPPTPQMVRDARSQARATTNVAEVAESEDRKASKKGAHHDQLPGWRASATTTEIHKLDSKKASISTQASTAKLTSQGYSRPERKADRPFKPERTDSEIRRLAREEVERYRQAERRMEAHLQPYAHGRLIPVERVPVERRIELQADVAQELPWKRRDTPHTSRKDSALALAATQGDDKQVEEVLVGREKNTAEDSWKPVMEHPLSPSTSSSRTRWPSATQNHHYRIEKIKDSAANQPPSVDSRRSRYEVVEVVDDWNNPTPEPHDRSTEFYYRSSRSCGVQEANSHSAPESSMSGRLSKLTDEEYWLNGEPARTADEDFAAPKRPSAVPSAIQERKERDYRYREHIDYKSSRTEQPDTKALIVASARQDAEIRSHSSREHQTKKTSRPQSPPYPRDGMTTRVPMPSPSSHASRARTSPKKETGNDSKYYYMKRTVEPVDRSSTERSQKPKYDYYRETEEYLHRCRAPPDETQTNASQGSPSKMGKRRPSDASSRVRFANKVEISPTPPNSDANSSEFRSFGQARQSKDGRFTEARGDSVAEYERRGRPLSREPARGHYERRAAREEPAMASDRDRTPRPSLRGRPSGSSETATALSTLPSNVKGFARVLSESPSREKLLEEARRQKVDGAGPYVREERRSASVDVEDGSMSSGSSCVDERDHRERHVRSRRHSRR